MWFKIHLWVSSMIGYWIVLVSTRRDMRRNKITIFIRFKSGIGRDWVEVWVIIGKIVKIG